MNPFQYVVPEHQFAATEAIGKHGRYLAGGIDLLGEMKDYIVEPDVLVNVNGLFADKKATAIQYVDLNHEWAIDATVTIAEIANHADLKKSFPGLVEAASEVGSPQIRNVATLAGNLLQHSRCWYYRQPDITCLKRGGTICYAQEGENKYSSLFSGCPCISPAVSNLATILTALNGSVVKSSEAKIPQLSMAELYSEAWKNPLAHNSLSPETLITDVRIPILRTRSAYRQVSEKAEFDWALVSCAAAGNVKDGKITDARVVLGAVAPVPYMVEDANKFLEGKPLTEETVAKAADMILKDAKPLAQNGYKIPLAHTLIRRTLLALNS